MKVLIAAGGTGGHVYPALAVARALMARGHGVVWVGNTDSFESRALAGTDIPFRTVTIAPLRGKGLKGWLLAPLRIWQAVRVAGAALRAESPDLVLGMGGYVAGPAGAAAALRGIPLVIHEQNARAGLTNRVLARLARRVLTGFDGVFARGLVVGNPVRAPIAALPPPVERWEGREGPLRLLVLGGSQGAQALNQRLPALFGALPAGQRPHIRHQGGRTVETALAAYRQAGVVAEVLPFIDDMAGAYAWADLIICRSGASTVAELAAAGLGGLLVPFPHAVDDHQTANAQVLVQAGSADCWSESQLTDTRFQAWWQALNRAACLSRAEAARGVALPQATDTIVAELETLGGPRP